MTAVLGVDVGTTGTKVVLVDGGHILAEAYQSYEYSSPESGWVEQDPEEIWLAVRTCIRACLLEHKDCRVMALSLSTQGGSLITLDTEMNPLRPLISWMDIRARDQLDKIKQLIGVDFIYERAGWKPINCFNLMQIMWLKEHEPVVFAQANMFVTVDAYINAKLTGNCIGDPSNAGISLLYDINQRCWTPELLNLCGISIEQLPKIQSSGSFVGTILPGLEDALGLSSDTIVVCGAHDQYCAAIGTGALSSGDLLLSCGTSWGMLSITDKPSFDTNSYVSVSTFPDDIHYGLFAYTPTGGAAMKWFKNNLNFTDSEQRLLDYDAIDRAVEQVPAGSRDVRVYPHFSGTSCPSWQSNNRATITGLSLSNKPADLARAVMEGVLFDLCWILDIFRASGFPGKRCTALGGAARSAVWMQMAADVLGIDVNVPAFVDAPALGAAIIAGRSAGLWADYKGGYEKLHPTFVTFRPDKEKYQIYQRLAQDYRDKFTTLVLYYQEKE